MNIPTSSTATTSPQQMTEPTQKALPSPPNSQPAPTAFAASEVPQSNVEEESKSGQPPLIVEMSKANLADDPDRQPEQNDGGALRQPDNEDSMPFQNIQPHAARHGRESEVDEDESEEVIKKKTSRRRAKLSDDYEADGSRMGGKKAQKPDEEAQE